MTATPPKSSTSLQQAKSRLETAIERLDRALAQRAKPAPSAAAGEPNSELEAARAEVQRLRETNATVSARLDATINKVKVLVDD